MPELAKLLLNPELPADFKIRFINPGGIFGTTQLRYHSCLSYTLYHSHGLLTFVPAIPLGDRCAGQVEASASATSAGAAQLLLHLAITGLIQEFFNQATG